MSQNIVLLIYFGPLASVRAAPKQDENMGAGLRSQLPDPSECWDSGCRTVALDKCGGPRAEKTCDSHPGRVQGKE